MSHRFPLFGTIFIVWALSKRGQTVLLYPENTVLQIVFGISVPIAQSEKGGISFSSCFQFNYVLPSNLSQLTLTVAESGRFQDLTLQDVYRSIEKMFNEYSWQSGRECLLRTICELAATPFDTSVPDEMREIMHLLFTPSEDLLDDKSSHHGIAKMYHDAEHHGKAIGNCAKRYAKCTESPLNSITQIYFQ